MPDVLSPRDAREAESAIADAVARNRRLELIGTGSKRGVGRPVAADTVLDLSGLRGVALYEPEELVLTAGPGTPMAEIEALLAQRGQELAFEPPDLGPLYGGAAGAGTLGGVVAGNLSGPRRIRAGAARDHFLGARAVSGRGEAFKTGGRVVKNVTGYDLCKLLAGSWGTLAALTEVTLKVMPRAESHCTLLLLGFDPAAAVRAMTAAAGSPHDVSGLAFLPAAAAARSNVAVVRGAGLSATAIRVEGPAASVAYRLRALQDALGNGAVAGTIADDDSRRLWREIRDVAVLAGDATRIVWRLSVPPADGSRVAAALAPLGDADWFMDWGGGLIWLSLPPADDAHAPMVRGALGAAAGGHATLLRAPAETRSRVDVFPPQPPALAALSRRVKDSLDPRGILNPGRMWR